MHPSQHRRLYALAVMALALANVTACNESHGSGLGTGGVGGSAAGNGGTQAGSGGGLAGGGAIGGGARGGAGGFSGAGSGGIAGSSGFGGSGGVSGVGGQGGVGGVGSEFGCAKNSDCIVVPESCCGTCGAATRGDAIAVNQSGLGRGECAMQPCPACYMEQDPTLVATCEGGQCAVVDLLDHDVTACSAPSECWIRTSDCTGCGANVGSGAIIAVSNEMLYQSLVCDGGEMVCTGDPIDAGWEAQCDAGHCRAVGGE